MVTGASSGIGNALAWTLAARGAHVVLVARSRDKLEALAKRIRDAGGQATVLAADLGRPGAARALYDESVRRDLAVDTLINNAGFGHWGTFESEPLDDVSSMLQVNVVALTELTRLMVPDLLARRGTLLNMASTVAFQPAPFMAVYGATKAFVLSFTEALWAEYRGRGLHVAALCPGAVETPFIEALADGARETRVFQSTLSVDEVVAGCLTAMERSAPSRVVGFKNWLLVQASRFSTRALTARIGASMLARRGASKALAAGGQP
jgi:short-subunit dehydrogenase